MVIRVDPEDLRAAVAEIGEAAGILGRAQSGRGADLAVAGQQTWSTTLMVNQAVRVWTPYLSGLHESMDGSANALRALADVYVAADWEAAQRHRRGGGGLFE